MCIHNEGSLYEIIKSTAIEVLEISEEAASNFARVATTRVTGFFLRFDKVPDHLLLKDIGYDGKCFIAKWESISTHASCPMCGKTSEREHSKHLYCEMVQDVGVNGVALWHEIYRKKYICTNDHCIQVNFIERFPGFVEKRYARMTVDLAEEVLGMGVNTSSRAAAKILQDQGVDISRDTIIRVILRRGAKQVEENFYDKANEVVNVGIDDINLRKGDSSTACMVIVNLDTGKLLSIVRGTTGETAQQVLGMFPNIKIVSRDRATAMASAAQALGKTSVADRYHLTANMHDAIERTLYEMLPASLYIPIGDSWVCLSNDRENGEIVVADIPASLTEQDIKQRVRIAHLTAKAEQKYRHTLRILELTLQGKSAQEISDIIEIPIEKVRTLRSEMRETVYDVEKKIDEFLADPHSSVQMQKSVSSSAQHSSKSKVEPYRDIVVAMRKEGKSHWPIYEAICKLGFKGSHSTVDNYIIKLEREASIDTEIKIERSISRDYFGSIPERPERISVRIYSVKTVYKRVLARIREHRYANADKKQNLDNEQPEQAPVKSKTDNAISANNRMNLPLELVNILKWGNELNKKSPEVIDLNAEASVEHYLNVMHPVYSHMIQFGVDYHNFMDKNNPTGLIEFIEKYKNDNYWRLAKFANGLQMDFEAVKNTLLYPNISNGIVEGTNSLTKSVKRVGGGKAKIDLLTAKMVIRQLNKPDIITGNAI